MIYILNGIKTNKYVNKIVSNNTVILFKRSMHRVTTKFIRAPANLIQNETSTQVSFVRGMSYTFVQKNNIVQKSPEECSNNPILTNGTGKPFQHPSLANAVCVKPNCETRSDCKNPCDIIKKVTNIGHATHGKSVPGAKRMSSKDLTGKEKEQYMVIYGKNERSTSIEPEKSKDQIMTDNLHKDKDAMNIIHIYKRMYDEK